MLATNELFVTRVLAANKVNGIESDNKSIEKSGKLLKTRKLSKSRNLKGRKLSQSRNLKDKKLSRS